MLSQENRHPSPSLSRIHTGRWQGHPQSCQTKGLIIAKVSFQSTTKTHLIRFPAKILTDWVVHTVERALTNLGTTLKPTSRLQYQCNRTCQFESLQRLALFQTTLITIVNRWKTKFSRPNLKGATHSMQQVRLCKCGQWVVLCRQVYPEITKSQEKAATSELGTSIHLQQPHLKSRPISNTRDVARNTNTYKAIVKSKGKPVVVVAAEDLVRL